MYSLKNKFYLVFIFFLICVLSGCRNKTPVFTLNNFDFVLIQRLFPLPEYGRFIHLDIVETDSMVHVEGLINMEIRECADFILAHADQSGWILKKYGNKKDLLIISFVKNGFQVFVKLQSQRKKNTRLECSVFF